MIRRTFVTALFSAIFFAFSIIAADFAIGEYGTWQTVLAARVVGASCLGAWLVLRRTPVRFPRKIWPVLGLLGLFDTLGYGLLYTGLQLENGEFAIVASSAYMVVTVLLARAYLRETVSPLQWLGILIVGGGIGTLALSG